MERIKLFSDTFKLFTQWTVVHEARNDQECRNAGTRSLQESTAYTCLQIYAESNMPGDHSTTAAAQPVHTRSEETFVDDRIEGVRDYPKKSYRL
jgi:hypothetical protein